jgi:acyl homoserine lactone synthase
MQHHVVSGQLGDLRFAQRYAEPMFRLRYQVFHERLGWQVNAEGGLETDEFDDADSHYVLITRHQRLVGGWRLRPTTTPYMLERIFPQLLGNCAAPCEPDVWEVSRFAIDTDGDRRTRFGLNAAALDLMAGTARFALERGIRRYVMVASAAAERLYRNAGLVVHRYAAPQRIGRVSSVGCYIDVDAHTCNVLLGSGAVKVAA